MSLPEKMETAIDRFMIESHLFELLYKEFCLMCVKYELTDLQQKVIRQSLVRRMKGRVTVRID